MDWQSQFKMSLQTLIRSIQTLNNDDLARFTSAIKHYVAFQREIEPLRENVHFRSAGRIMDMTPDGCLQEIVKFDEQEQDDLIAELERQVSLRTPNGHLESPLANSEIRGNITLVKFERITDTEKHLGRNVWEERVDIHTIYDINPPVEDEPVMMLTLNFGYRFLFHHRSSPEVGDVFWSSCEISAHYRPVHGRNSAPSHATLSCTALEHPEDPDAYAYEYRCGNLRDLLQAAAEDAGQGTMEVDVAGVARLDADGVRQLESFVRALFAPGESRGQAAAGPAFLDLSVGHDIVPEEDDAAQLTVLEVLLDEVMMARRKNEIVKFRKLEEDRPKQVREIYAA